MRKTLVWLTAAFIVTVIFGTIYVTVHQSQRMATDDPQIQMAQDIAAQLNNGMELKDLVVGNIDLGNSLAPATIIYDSAGQPIIGNGYLGGVLPVIPKGVLASSIGYSYNAVTWQPTDDVRLASVTVSANDYFVTSVRSLKEVEQRTTLTLKLAAMGWMVSMLALLGAYIISIERKVKKGRGKKH
ncbi:MAG TPA: hypothetical protein VI336_02625 [Candidatus Saccharimonadales bacterium]|nr:hypothetical protein [Candidatus Saccharimonadales bacterium]